MFKSILTCCSLLACSVAMANNTISFHGQISNRTCQVTVNGNTSRPIVILPTVSQHELDRGGKTAGTTNFNISLNDCPVSTTETKISTIFIGNMVTHSGNLGSSGTASNVEIQILDTNNTPINLSSQYSSNDINISIGGSSGAATYKAQYYATNEVTSGSVISTLQYAIAYQ